MSIFIAIAGCMLLAALACLLVPLRRSHGSSVRSRLLTGTALAIALSTLALFLYASLGTSRWQGADDLPSVEEMAGALEARLAREPGNPEGWLMLGRSYVVMQRFADAARAFGRAYELTGPQDAEVMTAYAEALVLSDPAALEGRAGALFTSALEIEPNDAKALWYGGLSAYASGDLEEARERWSRLRALAPPAAVDELLAERLEEIDQRLAATPAARSSSPTPPRPLPPGEGAGDSPGTGEIQINISLDPALAARLEPDAPLFIIAREPSGEGPPVAVVRRSAAALPLSVQLSDADAMLPGRVLSDFDELELVARIALSREALPASGDLFGEVAYRAGQARLIELTIDSVVP